MFTVKAYHPPGKARELSSQSGPFKSREEAERFAIGLAKTGQAYRCEITPSDFAEETGTRGPLWPKAYSVNEGETP